MKITKESTIAEVLENDPESGKHLMEAGMGCVGCPMAQMESIEAGCMAHGLGDKEIKELVKKLNK